MSAPVDQDYTVSPIKTQVYHAICDALHITAPLGSARGPRHPTLSDECAKQMVVARTSLITNYAFFGIIAAKLQLVEDNINCQTMATDGKHLFYNVGFVMGIDRANIDRDEYIAKLRQAFPDATEQQLTDACDGLTPGELRFVIVHEILHCMMEHFIRQDYREHKKWNRACDYAINQIIIREKIGDFRSSWLFDKKYNEKTAEEIYRLLEDEEDQDGEGGGGDSMDHHYNPGGQGGEGDDNDGDDRGSVGDLFSHADEESIKENFEDFKQTVINAAQAADVPAGVKRFIDDLAEPKIDWRTRIKRSLQSWMKRDMAFYRPNRKSWSLGCVMPGWLPQEDIDICIALDMSGSISVAMAKDMLSEVYGMMKQFDAFKIHLVCFDTRVYAPADFDESNVEKLFEYQIKGGGGTDFDAVWDYMKEKEYRPKQLLMFTDGYPWQSWGDPDYCDTMFIIHGTDSIVAPFGETLYYEFSEGVV